MQYEDLNGIELGQITVPMKMAEDMGWDSIREKIENCFRLMMAFQHNELKAWKLAVWQVYSAWNGSRSLGGV